MQFCFENNFEYNNVYKIKECLNLFINKFSKNKEIVFLCIGTDKVIGDSFGPMVGHMLREKYINVYGTLKNTVNATNINDVIYEINKKHNKPYIIAIDSALGDEEYINKIVIGKGGIFPGSALQKEIKKVGDMYINAIVGKNSGSNFYELKNAKMYNIFNLSNVVFKAINESLCLNYSTIVNNHIS